MKGGNALRYRGSNFLRQRLVLSTVSGRPVVITDIRVKDEEPGLRDYEASFVRLLDKLCSDISIDETGTTLKYRPGQIVGGSGLVHSCPPSRSLTYFLEGLLFLAPLAKQPLTAVVSEFDLWLQISWSRSREKVSFEPTPDLDGSGNLYWMWQAAFSFHRGIVLIEAVRLKGVATSGASCHVCLGVGFAGTADVDLLPKTISSLLDLSATTSAEPCPHPDPGSGAPHGRFANGGGRDGNMEARNVSAEQEHLLLFMHERFLSMQEAASFFGGEDGIEAVLSADEFSFALRQSGYGRPSEQLFHSFSGGQNRIKVRDLLQFIVRIAEPAESEAPVPPVPAVSAPAKEGSSNLSRSRVQLPGRALDSQSSLNSGQVKSVEDFGTEKQPSAKRQASFASSMQSLDRTDRMESTQEALPREGELQEALSEALRLLAEERRERLSDRAEAQRRHKTDIQTSSIRQFGTDFLNSAALTRGSQNRCFIIFGLAMGCGATKAKVAPQEPERLTAVVTDEDVKSEKAQLCSVVTGRSETAEIECDFEEGLAIFSSWKAQRQRNFPPAVPPPPGRGEHRSHVKKLDQFLRSVQLDKDFFKSKFVEPIEASESIEVCPLSTEQ
eukprot:s199_g6.t1